MLLRQKKLLTLERDCAAGAGGNLSTSNENMLFQNKTNVTDTTSHGAEKSALNDTSTNVTSQNATRRRLLEEAVGQEATVENEDNNVLEDEADASFDVFRSAEELAEDHGDQGLSDHYAYDYDDYVDESMWADDSWAEAQHVKETDYIDVDAHILCTPVSKARCQLHSSSWFFFFYSATHHID